MPDNATSGQEYALLDVKGDAQEQPAQPVKRQSLLKRIHESTLFKTLSILCLIIALFGGGVLAQFDPPDEVANMPMDILMTCITSFFLIEMMLQWIVERKTYPFSFFFWMDIIGTWSMCFEISYLLGPAGKIQETNSNMHAVAVRSARAARIGARAGRLSRPLRLLNRLLKNQEIDHAEAGYQAKVLGQRLTQVFSSKVAMLTVVLVLGVPVFNIGRFPEDDFSMRSWGDKLEADYARDFSAAANGDKSHVFSDSLTDMSVFYQTIGDYFPYDLSGYPTDIKLHGKTVSINGAHLVETQKPFRAQNVLRQEVSKCELQRPGCDDDSKASIYFNMTESNKHNAMLDMYVTIFIVMCMMIESCDLSFSIDRMMVKPMERMLDSARLMAKQLNQAMSRGKPGKMQEAAKTMTKELKSVDRGDDDDEEEEDDTENEIETLQELFKKVVFLINVFMEQDVAEQSEGMDEASAGVMNDIAQNGEAIQEAAKRASGVGDEYAASSKDRGSAIAHQTHSAIIPVTVPTAPVPVVNVKCDDTKSFMSWGFNVLELTPDNRDKVLKEIMFTSDTGKMTGKVHFQEAAFQQFCKEAEAGYSQLPYHNFTHAVEVFCSMYRWLRQMQWQTWLSDLDASALLISALVADIGHPGRTNAFLVETSHDLALSYNDKSPLENMHCAKLFEILKTKPDANVFKDLGKAQFRHVRAVCIEAILHTDNSLHFDLVKAIKKVYGMASDMCDAQAGSPAMLATQFVTEVLQEQTPLWRKVSLHLADLSNQALQFPVAKLWANCIMDEFFAQGDEEKKLGIPVGMLNDRSKVSLPGSQFGFSSMLFTPLVVNLVYVFPMINPVAETVVSNTEAWLNEWRKEAGFKEGQQAEKLRKFKEQVGKFTAIQNNAASSTGSDGKQTAAAGKNVTMENAGTVNLKGHWTCTGTWGLEEFLKSTNVSWARRKAAMSAPWPSWEFQQSGDNIVFINNSAVGVLREEITADNKPFTIVDGWKQEVKCKAFWENGALVIEKTAPQGSFREERLIDKNGKLQFSLQPMPEGLKWGRTFEPKKKK